MTAGLVVLLALSFVAFFNLGLTWYTHFGTYALFPKVSAETGHEGFRRYHQAYQRKLPFLAWGPFAVIMLLSLTFLFVHPPEAQLWARILVLVFNATVAVVSARFAGPTHKRILAAGEVSEKDGKALLRWNAVRLDALLLSTITIVYLLVQSIT